MCGSPVRVRECWHTPRVAIAEEALRSPMTNNLVRQMLEQIHDRYADVLTLRRMSATLGSDPAYLGRLFRQEVGSTVRDYLTCVRLEHAAKLVLEGVKIEAVALSVGYRSKKNFYQRFERRFGTTPVRYRSWSASATG